MGASKTRQLIFSTWEAEQASNGHGSKVQPPRYGPQVLVQVSTYQATHSLRIPCRFGFVSHSLVILRARKGDSSYPANSGEVCSLATKTSSSSREVRVSWYPIFFAFVYFSRVPNPPNQKRNGREGHLAGGPREETTKPRQNVANTVPPLETGPMRRLPGVSITL